MIFINENDKEVLDDLPIIICDVDLKINIQYINNLAYKTFGYTREDIRNGLNAKKFLTDDSNRKLTKTLKKLFNGEKTEPARYNMIKKDGTIFHASINSNPLYDENERMVGIRSLFYDINDTIKTEKTLKDSEAHYRVILNSITDPMQVIDKDYNIITTNPAFQKFFGSSDNDTEFIGHNLFESFPFLDIQKVKKEYEEVFQSGKVIQISERTLINDKEFFTEITKIPLIHQGVVNRVVSIIRDVTDHKVAELHLKESEEMYRLISEEANDLIAILSDKFKYEYINEKVTYKYMGFKKEEVLGKSCLDFLHPDDISLAIKILNRGMRSKTAEKGEVRFKHKEGHWVWLENSGQTFTDNEGKVKVLVISRVITERKKAEQKLRESEEKYRFITENANDIITILDSELKVDFFNKAAYDISGFTSDEIVGKSVINFAHPDDIQDSIKLLKDSWNSGSGRADVRSINKDGSWIWYDVKGSVFTDYNGEKKAILISRDISKRKETERQLKDHTRKIEIFNEIIMICNKAHDLQVFLDEILSCMLNLVNFDGGGIYLVNKDTQTASIISHNKLPDDFIEDVKIVDINKEPYSSVFIQGQAIITDNYDKINPKRAKKWNILSLASIPLFSKNNIVGAMNIILTTRYTFSDLEKEILVVLGREIGTVITKLKAEKDLQEALNNAEFYKDLFVHDMNNILHNIALSTQLYSIYKENPEKRDEFMETSNQAAKRGSILISNVRKLTSLDNHTTKLVRVSLVPLIREAINFSKKLFSEQEIKFSLNEDRGIAVQANELLVDVFENLLSNGIKYNDSKVIILEIKISEIVKNGKACIKIEFIDNGIGIFDHKKKEIFTRSNNGSDRGMGIGLSLVKKIIDQYNGRIWVENKVAGEYKYGSNFIILLQKA